MALNIRVSLMNPFLWFALLIASMAAAWLMGPAAHNTTQPETLGDNPKKIGQLTTERAAPEARKPRD